MRHIDVTLCNVSRVVNAPHHTAAPWSSAGRYPGRGSSLSPGPPPPPRADAPSAPPANRPQPPCSSTRPLHLRCPSCCAVVSPARLVPPPAPSGASGQVGLNGLLEMSDPGLH